MAASIPANIFDFSLPVFNVRLVLLTWRVPSNVCTKNRLNPFKDTDKMSELTEAQFESSDDELPEEVAFDASKSAALKSVKDALEAAKTWVHCLQTQHMSVCGVNILVFHFVFREKKLLKEKRKKRQQLFQEQKVQGGEYGL